MSASENRITKKKKKKKKKKEKKKKKKKKKTKKKKKKKKKNHHTPTQEKIKNPKKKIPTTMANISRSTHNRDFTPKNNLD